jgi:hypothetical protein
MRREPVVKRAMEQEKRLVGRRLLFAHQSFSRSSPHTRSLRPAAPEAKTCITCISDLIVKQTQVVVVSRPHGKARGLFEDFC